MVTNVSCGVGDMLLEQGAPVNRLYVLLSGRIREERAGVALTLGPGSIIGLSDALYERYDANYIAEEECQVMRLSYRGTEDFYKIFDSAPYYIFGFSKGILHQCQDLFNVYDNQRRVVDELYNLIERIAAEYKALCDNVGYAPTFPMGFSERGEFAISYGLTDWEKKYVASLYSIDNARIEAIYGGNQDIAIGLIGVCCNMMERAVDAISESFTYCDANVPFLISESGNDLFQSIFELQVFLAQREMDQAGAKELLVELYNFVVDNGLADELMCHTRLAKYEEHNFEQDAFDFARKKENALPDNMFEHIMGFAGIEKDRADKIKKHLDVYRAVEDKLSKEDNVRRMRKNLTEDFYEVYEKAFEAANRCIELSPMVKLFLYFGVMDTEGFSDDYVERLLKLVQTIPGNDGSGVYTLYSWLKQVWIGEKEPSKNEMDMDYRGFILEQRKNGEIREDEVPARMNDQSAKFRYELDNFFKSGNRTTSGKMGSFCPVTFADDFTMEPEAMMLNVMRIKLAIRKVEDVDFSIFYRDVMFSDADHGIKTEQVKRRIEPDIILFPNVGSRSMLWQECGGVKIEMPGRMVFPIFLQDDLDKQVQKNLGAFRWEICKREQGGRWNDIHTQCLTSDFYDYFTFYKKNKELSQEQKEKLKSLMSSSRNNTREAFSRLYSTWIAYESAGNMRLNRVEREYFSKHVPFAKTYRLALSGHPSYGELISRYNILNGQKVHHYKMVLDKYLKQGGNDADPIRETIAVLEM